MPTDIAPLVAQLGFSGLLLIVIIYLILPRLDKLTRAMDRLAMAQLIQLAESEHLTGKLRQRAIDLQNEIKTGKDDLP